jgi:hypothetical protein
MRRKDLDVAVRKSLSPFRFGDALNKTGQVTSHQLHAPCSDDLLTAIGLAIAALGPFVVAGLLVPFRDHVVGENVALVFVVVVVVAAACGGRRPGALAAVVSALTYDFFFTRPYQSLKIDRAEDLGTVLVLLAISLLVAELMAVGQRRREASRRARDDIERLHRVAAALADGTETEDVLRSVEAELLGLLSLQDCRYEQPPYSSSIPRMERNGTIEGGRRRFVAGQFTLPGEGVEIPVLLQGRALGRFVLVPDWHVGVALEERVAAIALVDLVAAAFMAEPSSRRNTEGNAS